LPLLTFPRGGKKEASPNLSKGEEKKRRKKE